MNILLVPTTGAFLFFVFNAIVIVFFKYIKPLHISNDSLYHTAYTFYNKYYFWISLSIFIYSLVLGISSDHFDFLKEQVNFLDKEFLNIKTLAANFHKMGVEFLFFAFIVSLFLFSFFYLKAVEKKFYRASMILPGNNLEYNAYYQSLLQPILSVAQKTMDYKQIDKKKEDILLLEEDKYASALSVIKWAEVTLPVIGFLGTVLGMKLAMNDINNEEEVINGMKVAFNTTLYGLGCLLILGVIHLITKRKLAARLDEIRTNLNAYIISKQLFKTKGGAKPSEDKNEEKNKDKNKQTKLLAKIVEVLEHMKEEKHRDNLVQFVQNINQRIEDLQDQLDMIDRQLAETSDHIEDIMFSERDVSRVMINTRDSIEKVIYKVPAFQHIKNVLFYPILEFDDLTRTLSINIQEFLSNYSFYDEKWYFSAIWSSTKEDGHSYSLICTDKGLQYLFQFNFEGNVDAYKVCSINEKYEQFIPLSGTNNFIGINEKKRPYIIEIPKYNYGKEEGILTATESNIPTRFFYKIIGVYQSEKYGSKYLFIYYLHAGFISVELINIEGLDHSSLPYKNEELKCSDIYAMDEKNGTLYIVVNSKGEHGSQPILLILSFMINKKKRNYFEVKEKINRKVLFPNGVNPNKIVVLNKEEVLILDDKGELYYWKNQFATFVKLQSNYWEAYPDKEYEIRVGSNGWIAVTVGGILRMWQLRRQFQLVAYEELFPPRSGDENRMIQFSIKNSVARTLKVSSDKQFIFGIQDDAKALPVWRFPVIQGDIRSKEKA